MTSLSVERTADTGFVDTEGIDVREIRAALTAKAPQQVAPQQEQPASAPVRQRDRYIDTLRAVALVRVMTYHSFGWAWLPLLFPSMGIMFALAGSLVAASLDRSPGNPWRVLRKRTVRLLPPVWRSQSPASLRRHANQPHDNHGRCVSERNKEKRT